ncbi:MAG: DNA alkylation repair protein [bacterium]
MKKAAKLGLEPSRIASEIIAFLRANASAGRARSSQRYFKEPVQLYGIQAHVLRKHAKSLASQLKGKWSWVEAVSLVDALIQEPQLETKAMGLLILGQFEADLPAHLLPRIKSWLAWHSGNWATVDLLAPDILGPLLDRHPDLITEVESWSGSPNLWVRRGAMVAFVKHARQGKHLGAVYRIAEKLLADQEDLMHKAVGWVLREAGKTDAERLERFLLRHGLQMARTSVRYAIERFPETDRKRLLVVTRR